MLVSEAAQSTWTWAPLLAAGVAGVFALIGVVASLAANRRDRRRELYAEAFRAALALVEMVYRLRSADPDNARALADHYHQLHEDINFHQEWIESESEEMGRAYRRLLLRIRAETRDPMRDGWSALRQRLAEKSPVPLGDISGGHPDVTAAKRQVSRRRLGLSKLDAQKRTSGPVQRARMASDSSGSAS
jgi:hypothetical protein